MPISPARGRVVGVVLLLQMALGLILPFVLIGPINVGSPGFLVHALSDASAIRAAVLVGFAGAALCVVVSALSFPVIRQHSDTFAIALVSACTVSAALDAVHNGTVMSLLAMAKQAAALPLGDTSHLAAAAAVYSARVTAHYTQLFGFAWWLFVFYAAMFRTRLIPRPIAFIAIIAVAAQFIGVTLSHYLDYPMQGGWALPLAPIHAFSAIWMTVRGFGQTLTQQQMQNVEET
ncbi:MAG: DUF4386 domain-containing protein [Acidobacteria bacterium]|nr:DUF4386 domain-containing protein [Acidobacteriota bacterium]